MNPVQKQVLEFHKVYDCIIAKFPSIPDHDTCELRIKLIEDEFFELKDAITAQDIVEIADAIGDLLYVVYGTAIAFGIDMEPISDEIQRSNLSKLGSDGKAIKDNTGKVLKGPNFSLPDLKSILMKQSLKPIHE